MEKRFLVVDLEATCADDGSIAPEEMEIIEIGACWATQDGAVLERFQHLVRPLMQPVLTAFCKQLIGITQAEVDQAPLFPVAARALQAFANNIESTDTVWMSWGNYDCKQLSRDAERHGIAMPLIMPHQNAKRLFAKAQRIGKEVGMVRACALTGNSMEGQHHRGLDDAVNIARLIPWVLGNATISAQGQARGVI
jgi:inhibitor of KinA sporulation pathway (predicted exonuclease)